MIKPMMDIASIIEAREDIKIIITKGGSGNLLKSILYTKSGDLYLPGSDRYYQIIQQDHPGIILETVHVGTNKAAIMVQRGNPRAISNDLLNFTSKEYAVVIGNANSGSIGNETQNILEKKGIYDRVLQNAMQLTTDSKDLTKVLVNRQADLVINWYAASTWDENRAAMEALEIDPEFARPQQLILGLLKYSKNRETARKFMAYAASDRGKAIFKHHGLYFD
jgi:molybdate transport system substrate-binding protein